MMLLLFIKKINLKNKVFYVFGVLLDSMNEPGKSVLPSRVA